MISTLLALASLLAWLYLIVAHGSFWRLTEHDRHFAPQDAPKPDGMHIIAIVPARNEADVIASSLSSLFSQSFSGLLEVVLVDDDSTDGTAKIATRCAEAENATERFTILSTKGVASGWTGKIAAMNHGFAHVRSLPRQPDFVLFCDADIALGANVVERLATGSPLRETTLASLMVRLRCESSAERWFIPAFVFFFQKLYPFSRVNDPNSEVAGAAGGVMLVPPEALSQAGGLEAIRGALIDDCALGSLMKRQGPIWLGLTDDAWSLRAYPSYADIASMVTRSAYAQLRYSPLRLLIAVAGMSLVYLAPPILAIFADSPAREIALAAYLLMALAYMPSLRFYGLSLARAFALPAIAACYTWFTLESARRHLRGRGGEWKGRYQAPFAGKTYKALRRS
jgi:hopene-associated glycosyltransferase HpnB